MARPRKSIKTLKAFQVNIRLTLFEQMQVEKQANIYGISVTEFVRIRVLDKQLPKLKIAPINRELLVAISRCGNNINQLTKQSHNKNSNVAVLRAELNQLTELINQVKHQLLE